MTIIFKAGLEDIETELKTMAGWLNDPEVVRYSEQRHKKHDIDSQHRYIINFDGDFKRIFASNKFIGTITARIDRPNSVADVGILIGEKSEWGKGYGTEAWTLFCDHLFHRGIRKIEAGAMIVNIPMGNIFRKYEMFREGIRERHFLYENCLVGMTMWGKFK